MFGLEQGIKRLIEIAIVLCMAVMLLLVFGNVFLRYAFNSGITVSEELSRYLFVWIVFLGAVRAAAGGEHLGIDTLLRKIPLAAKRGLGILNSLLVLFACAVLAWGSWHQVEINIDNHAPVTGIPVAILYAAGLFASMGIAYVQARRLLRFLSGSYTEKDLYPVQDSEDNPELAPPASGAEPGTRGSK